MKAILVIALLAGGAYYLFDSESTSREEDQFLEYLTRMYKAQCGRDATCKDAVDDNMQACTSHYDIEGITAQAISTGNRRDAQNLLHKEMIKMMSQTTTCLSQRTGRQFKQLE